MRDVGLDTRMATTAGAGRFGRTCFVWKGQVKRLKNRGIHVELIQQGEKAHYLAHLSWATPKEGTFSEDLYHLSSENSLPRVFQEGEYDMLARYLKQVANMISFSTILTVPDENMLKLLQEGGFTYTPLRKEDPFTVFVDWSAPTDKSSMAAQLHKEVVRLAMTEYSW